MPETRIDKDLVRRRFARGAASYRGHAVVQPRMAENLIEAIAASSGPAGFTRGLEIGCGVGTLTRLLLARLKLQYLAVNDIAETLRPDVLALAGDYPGVEVEFIGGDVERVALPDRLDLVAANAVFQWLTDVADLYDRLAEQMWPGALLAISTFGPGNLSELAAVTGLSLGYRSLDEHRRLLQRRFRVRSAWEEREILHMNSPLEVLRHLKATGANALTAPAWCRGDLARFSADYVRRFGHDGRVTVSYHPLYVVAERRHD